MPRLNNRVPQYRRHRASGQAVLTLDRPDFYLGPFGTAASRREYDPVIGEWVTAGRRLPTDPNAITIAEVVAAYRKHCQSYYRHPDGTPTSESARVDREIAPLVKLYGKSAA